MKDKVTRRDILPAGAAAVFTGGVGLVSVSTRKAVEYKSILDNISDTHERINSLASACLKRWKHNIKYVPTQIEVKGWVEAVLLYDKLIQDPLHYLSLIDLESSGNPTILVKRWNARGLGCVRYVIAKDLVKRLRLKIYAVGSALFNPQFNIFCMIKIFEECYMKAGSKNRMKRALNYYIAGKARTDRHVAAGKEPDRYIDLYNARRKSISKLMKQGGEG